MKNLLSFCLWCALCVTAATAQTSRALWASINGRKDASLGNYQQHTGKVLISWRMLPGDNADTAFDLYRKAGTTTEKKIASGLKQTNFQDEPTWKTIDNVYRLTYAGSDETLATFTLTKAQLSSGLPYISIPLKETSDVCADEDIVYYANDCSAGDLDGDGEMEIVVKRLLGHKSNNNTDEGTGAGDSDPNVRHTIIWDAYKLDGTLLWRIKSGPNIILGNSSNFGIADLDGDGKAEFVTKTGEGTVFGDNAEIGDTDGDGKTDYRSVWPAGHYTGDGPKGYGGPEFFSVCDGATGRELARADFICRGKEGETPAELAANWYQNDWAWDPRDKKYQWKLANSLRLGIASFDGKKNQIFLGRGVYGKTIVEGWDYSNGQLTRLWHFDSSASGGKDTNKDGKANSAYAGQGNHSFNVADLDGDGKDEVMYGSCAFDDDGTGLWSTGLGHGDANHVGKFIPGSDGLQVFHCLENGKTMCALHNAKDGSIIWSKVSGSDNDTGRCNVADMLPGNPGFEFYYYQSNLFSTDGTDLDNNTKSIKGGCGMNVWFDGTLLREQIEGGIIQSWANGRTFTMYRYDMSFNNGSKSNPGLVADILGDWREEVITPDGTKLADLKIFSTWYPTTHRFPWLMTDHTYCMSVINQNVGYNQPSNLGYYLGADLESDEQAWEDGGYTVSAIQSIKSDGASCSDQTYNLMGQKVTPGARGLYIRNGKKIFILGL